MYALVTFENPYLLQKPVFTTHEINVLFRSVDEHHYGHAQNLIYYTYLQHITYTFLQGIKRGADENHHVQNRIYYTYLQHILCVQEGVRHVHLPAGYQEESCCTCSTSSCVKTATIASVL